MKISKHAVTLGAIAITAGAAIAAGVGPVSAQFGANRDEMSQKIAERFNLNQDEVQSFFEEQRAEHQAERQVKFEENLSQAVADGKITEAQRQAILAKHEEVKSYRDSLKDMEPEERREAMQSQHEEMKTWAEGQGIDMQDIMPGPGEGRGMRKGQGKGMGMHAQQ